MKKFVLCVLTLFILAACSVTNNGSTTESVVGTWELVSYGSPSEQTPAVPDVDTFIEFNSEGNVSGNVGCNGFGGDYTVDGNTITFSAVVATLMFCDGAVGSQELTTLAVFQASATFVLDRNTLTITSPDGASSIVLAKK